MFPSVQEFRPLPSRIKRWHSSRIPAEERTTAKPYVVSFCGEDISRLHQQIVSFQHGGYFVFPCESLWIASQAKMPLKARRDSTRIVTCIMCYSLLIGELGKFEELRLQCIVYSIREGTQRGDQRAMNPSNNIETSAACDSMKARYLHRGIWLWSLHRVAAGPLVKSLRLCWVRFVILNPALW